MRISVDSTDAGHKNWRQRMAGHVHVFLNGKAIKGAITADDDSGEVIIYARSPDGSVTVNHDLNEVMRETLRGEVRIEFDEGFAPKDLT